ncbi:Dynein regulatory complex subunit 6 [Larimichthys crocea]|uniref:Uncharacterized protein n=1 Tax=Larimichthys crocea TaxID=215358 RepID=A0ACD3QEL6_LARCR|nr:Dynein regulatory complex subunit 6 [Larimichthys crocea]
MDGSRRRRSREAKSSEEVTRILSPAEIVFSVRTDKNGFGDRSNGSRVNSVIIDWNTAAAKAVEEMRLHIMNCLNLQYLSLAYCYRFTDKGFMYLTTGKGCHNLFHLNLSGCTQMTVDGFRYISAGCPSLKEIVINDMPTLSDSCVLVSFHQHITDFAQGQHPSSGKFKRETEEFALSTCIFVAAKKSLTLLLQALIARCRCLSAISLLDAPHLSDVAFKAYR